MLLRANRIQRLDYYTIQYHFVRLDELLQGQQEVHVELHEFDMHGVGRISRFHISELTLSLQFFYPPAPPAPAPPHP